MEKPKFCSLAHFCDKTFCSALRIPHTMENCGLCANRTCNTTVSGSCCIRESRIWYDPVIFPVIGLSVLSAASQNACRPTHARLIVLLSITK